jgi:flavin reductase (DIM6/NTAB) family NADH-FMN oxidoreductase RutF
MSTAAIYEDITADAPRAGPDSLSFRSICGAYPTGVAIVSTRTASGAPCGLTINSFSSVSLDPPLVLWGLSRTSPSLEHFDQAEAFVINMLAEDQAELASKFARPALNKFDGVLHRACPKGAPIIEGCLAQLECRPWSRIEAGDHIVYIWQVEHAQLLSLRSPLAFHGGKFKRIAS